MQNLENVIREWDAKAIDLSRRIAEYERLKAGSERLKSQYDRLLSNLRSLDVTKNLDQDMISILERASASISTLPQLHIVLLKGCLLGILLSVGVLFLIDKLDDRFTSFVEFRSHFPENILVEIPHGEISQTSQLLQRDDPRRALLESFSTLRSSLAFLPSDGPKPKLILVTSAAPSEGKTTVSANFAVTLARSGNRVLLVDADLRRGRLQSLFKLPSNSEKVQGISETLTQQTPWRSSVVQTEIDNLHLLPRGRALTHPSEYLLGTVTDRFLSETAAEYDYVVLDSAPVLVGDDALSLAPKCDGLMFVVRFSQSSVRQCRRALDSLRNRRVRLLGIVCNDVKASAAEYDYYYSENYHATESTD
jgi:capsular exopolysaccharide synthesis family protein